jgi:hypothetical protein
MDVAGWDNKRIEREGGVAYLDAQAASVVRRLPRSRRTGTSRP